MKVLARKGNISAINSLILLLVAASMIVINCSGPSKDTGAILEKGFQNPPPGAKPRV